MTTAQTSNLAKRDEIENVVRRAAVLAYGLIGVAVGAIVGLLALKVVGLVVGAVVVGGVAAAVGSITVRRVVDSALATVMSRVDSHDIAESESARLFNLLEGLCAVTGVQIPSVTTTNDTGINAFVAADPARAQVPELVVTSGFVSQLERIEMEGVVAVCLARLRSGVAEAQTLVTALSLAKPWYVTSSTIRRLVAATSEGQIVFDDDIKGAGITRYPPGLAAAYQRMLENSTRVGGFDARLACLWVVNPSGEANVAGNSAAPAGEGSKVATPTDDRPPLTERLALLREI